MMSLERQREGKTEREGEQYGTFHLHVVVVVVAVSVLLHVTMLITKSFCNVVSLITVK